MLAGYGRSSYWEEIEAETLNLPTQAEILSVLRTREHIPNKIEGEKARQAKAKTRHDARNNRCIMRRGRR